MHIDIPVKYQVCFLWSGANISNEWGLRSAMPITSFHKGLTDLPNCPIGHTSAIPIAPGVLSKAGYLPWTPARIINFNGQCISDWPFLALYGVYSYCVVTYSGLFLLAVGRKITITKTCEQDWPFKENKVTRS